MKYHIQQVGRTGWTNASGDGNVGRDGGGGRHDKYVFCCCFFFLLSSCRLLIFIISFVADYSNRWDGTEWDRTKWDDVGGNSNAGRDGMMGRLSVSGG